MMTDDEIDAIFMRSAGYGRDDYRSFARAVLAARPAPDAAKDYDWMPEARQMAAQCWCEPETSGTEMDAILAEAVARRIAAWMQTGAFHARNEAYWRDRAKAAEAAQPAPVPVPPGWKLVPVEPTTDQIGAAFDLFEMPHIDGFKSGNDVRIAIYRAMIAASPEVPRV